MDIGNFKSRDPDQEDAWAEWLGAEPSDEENKAASEAPRDRQQPQSGQSGSMDGFGSSTSAKPRETHQRAKSHSEILQDQTDNPTIAISIQMPEFHLPRVHIPWRRIRPWAIGALSVILLIFGGKFVIDHLPSHKQQAAKTSASVQAAIDLGYKPVVPSAREATQAQPSKPLYNSQKKFYYYSDTFNGADMYVTQQGVPSSLKDNSDAIVKYAKSIGATEKFTTTLGTVYISPVSKADSDSSSNTTAQSSQRLVLVNDKMLLFIQSTKQLDTTSWVDYLQDLE